MDDIGFILVAAAVAIGLPVFLVAALVWALSIGGLKRRLARLERAVSELQALETGLRTREPLAPLAKPAAELQTPPLAGMEAAAEPFVAAELAEAALERRDWETLVGGRALGWLAVVVLLFATSFFLKYAFENQWIGPIGRVSLGVLAGTALAIAGRQYDRRGWRIFSQMLTAGGVVLLYLSTYGAFGFYHLIGQRGASLMLALIVTESGLLALRYEAPAIALMAVIGGLLTPLLMHADRDQYAALFSYLTVLDAGIVCLLLRRHWPAIGVVGMAGTQLLFWLWYADNFHPEKRNWAIGFQTAVYALFLAQMMIRWRAGRRSDWEELLRMLLAAAFWFSAAYVLLKPDFRGWLGALAVGMAAIYGRIARWLLAYRCDDGPAQLAALAIAMGFLAIAFPLEADAPWVALGWAAEAGGLWWFGVRIRSAPLRVMAAALAALSMARIAFVDAPWTVDHSAWPALNRYALPGLAAVLSLACALAASKHWLSRLTREELALVMIAGICCVLMAWALVSADLLRYFRVLAQLRVGQRDWTRWGQTWLSIWWAAYATVVLSGGFYARQPWLRWTALGLYAVAAAKVFIVDMAELDELYRIAAFFVLALVLGAATWAYHRFQPNPRTTHAA